MSQSKVFARKIFVETLRFSQDFCAICQKVKYGFTNEAMNIPILSLPQLETK